MESSRFRTAVFTALALTAFAANSLLCRQALGHASIDAATFSTIRLASGAVALIALAWATGGRPLRVCGTWGSAAMLFLYAIPFSFAYVRLGAGTGALVLFGAVQSTMLAWAIATGERPLVTQWLGFVVALGGLVYLVMPGLAAPSLIGCGLMVIAGAAWGVYSLRGKGQASALAETAGNFARAVPLAVGVSVAMGAHGKVSVEGAVLAVVSGVLTSGLGYVAWFAALSGLTTTSAAFVQLLVPVLAAAGGVLFLAERITARLFLAAVLILGGVALALTRTERRRQRPRPLESRPADARETRP
jgi:drug/metabolite transporter (DMT)-like permease